MHPPSPGTGLGARLGAVAGVAKRLEVGVRVAAPIGQAEDVVYDGCWSSTRDTAVVVALEGALSLLLAAVTTALGTLLVALALVASLADKTT